MRQSWKYGYARVSGHWVCDREGTRRWESERNSKVRPELHFKKEARLRREAVEGLGEEEER